MEGQEDAQPTLSTKPNLSFQNLSSSSLSPSLNLCDHPHPRPPHPGSERSAPSGQEGDRLTLPDTQSTGSMLGASGRGSLNVRAAVLVGKGQGGSQGSGSSPRSANLGDTVRLPQRPPLTPKPRVCPTPSCWAQGPTACACSLLLRAPFLPIPKVSLPSGPWPVPGSRPSEAICYPLSLLPTLQTAPSCSHTPSQPALASALRVRQQ